MNKKSGRSSVVAPSLIVAGAYILAPGSLLAGGIELYEIATPDVGLASAGYAARADDASTLFKNPAGMSRLADSQFQGGLQALYGSVNFTRNASTSGFLGTDNGGNAVGALPGASMFIVLPASEKFAVGFGTFSNFGLAEHYDNNWVGRYYVQSSTLIGMSFMPAVSYKANDWFSVGVALNAMYGYLDSDVAIRTLGSGDGQMTLHDSKWGFGGNVGFLFEPSRQTRFGITYTSPVQMNFGAKPTFSNLGPLGSLPIFTNSPNLNLGITVPQSVMVGVYHDLNSAWAVMADVGWQNWRQFGMVSVGVDSSTPTSLTANLNYQDTWHGAAGLQFRASEKWTLTGGVAYDSSAVSDQDRTVTVPMGKAYRFGAGTQWQASHALDFGIAYEFLWAGDMPVTQTSAYRGTVSGSYNDAWFSFLTVNLTWKF
jgi:long-chain fatty acid transport protein